MWARRYHPGVYWADHYWPQAGRGQAVEPPPPPPPAPVVTRRQVYYGARRRRGASRSWRSTVAAFVILLAGALARA